MEWAYACIIQHLYNIMNICTHSQAYLATSHEFRKVELLTNDNKRKSSVIFDNSTNGYNILKLISNFVIRKI